MNTGIWVLTTLMALIGAAPFALMAMSKRKKRNTLLKLVQAMPEAQGLTLIDHDYCGDILLCMDSGRTHVFFAKIAQDDEHTSKCVNLTQIVRCEPFKECRTVKGDGGTYTVIDRMELRFFVSKNSTECKRFTLYNADKSYKPSSEQEVMERWVEKINAQVGNPSKRS